MDEYGFLPRKPQCQQQLLTTDCVPSIGSGVYNSVSDQFGDEAGSGMVFWRGTRRGSSGVRKDEYHSINGNDASPLPRKHTPASSTGSNASNTTTRPSTVSSGPRPAAQSQSQSRHPTCTSNRKRAKRGRGSLPTLELIQTAGRPPNAPILQILLNFSAKLESWSWARTVQLNT
ncbi:hypothetical protein BKA70DRAFT_1445843 [Coprinopsis sp. MPI-PUGE-AT-0042]|nr:hypothetical protein BKA70DRAFT_1445843 [Coprinopsis sp. MPI-PUGE-AT-0042]